MNDGRKGGRKRREKTSRKENSNLIRERERQRSSLRINAEEWISVYNYNEVRG